MISNVSKENWKARKQETPNKEDFSTEEERHMSKIHKHRNRPKFGRTKPRSGRSENVFPPDHKAAKSRNRKAKQPKEGGTGAGARTNSLQRKSIKRSYLA